MKTKKHILRDKRRAEILLQNGWKQNVIFTKRSRGGWYHPEYIAPNVSGWWFLEDAWKMYVKSNALADFADLLERCK